jgi:hypothetical protein
MRYLIEPEFRVKKPPKPVRSFDGCASDLRRELAQRNIRWALMGGYSHEVGLGNVPVVLYREDERSRHGNFHAASFRRIRQQPLWTRRLAKVHTSARRTLLSRDAGRRELDSSNSSDALLMNVFCHPETLNTPAVRALLGIGLDAEPIFGHRPGVPLRSGRRDCTEIDLKLGNLLIEAKLTEYDFQSAPLRLIERYSGLEEVFDRKALEVVGGRVQSYQLIRGVLAAHASLDGRFCVLCDARRRDLIAEWQRIVTAVRLCELRPRLQLLTWQELAKVLPTDLRQFLDEKFGIGYGDRWSDVPEIGIEGGMS